MLTNEYNLIYVHYICCLWYSVYIIHHFAEKQRQKWMSSLDVLSQILRKAIEQWPIPSSPYHWILPEYSTLLYTLFPPDDFPQYAQGCLNMPRDASICPGMPQYVQGCLNMTRDASIWPGVHQYDQGCLNMTRGASIWPGMPQYDKGCINMTRDASIWQGVHQYDQGCLNMTRDASICPGMPQYEQQCLNMPRDASIWPGMPHNLLLRCGFDWCLMWHSDLVNNFHSGKCIWKYHFGNGGHFVQGEKVN